MKRKRETEVVCWSYDDRIEIAAELFPVFPSCLQDVILDYLPLFCCRQECQELPEQRFFTCTLQASHSMVLCLDHSGGADCCEALLCAKCYDAAPNCFDCEIPCVCRRECAGCDRTYCEIHIEKCSFCGAEACESCRDGSCSECDRCGKWFWGCEHECPVPAEVSEDDLEED